MEISEIILEKQTLLRYDIFVNLYKPNAKNSGHAIGLNFNSKEGRLFVQLIKQVGWDDSTKTGTFKGGKFFNVTFNAHEIGAALNCIESSIATKLFHKTDKGSTSIEWAPFVRALPSDRTTGVQPPPPRAILHEKRDGITLSVNPRATEANKEPVKFGFWFNESEARLLKEYLRFVLSHFFTAEYSADKQRREEAFAKKKAEGVAGASQPTSTPDDSF